MIGVSMGYTGDGVSLTGQEAEKMSNITTHPSLPQHLNGTQRIEGTHSLMDWIILSCREAWPNERYLPWYVGPGKSIEEVQQILKKLGMRQAIYTCL